MGKTIKEFAVKITVDAKQFKTAIDKFKDSFTRLIAQSNTLFVSIESKSKKAGDSINRHIVKEIDKAIEKQKELERVQGSSGKQSVKARQRTVSEIDRLNRQQTANRKKAERDKVNAVKAAEKEIKRIRENVGFKPLDVVKINKEEPIKDVQSLGRALQSANKDVQERIRRQLKNLDSNRIEDVRKGQQTLLRIINSATQKQMSDLRKAAESRLALAGTNSRKRQEIEKELQDDLKEIRDQAGARRDAVRQTGEQREQDAPNEDRVGRIGRGGDIFSELQGRIGGATGALGGFLTGLGAVGVGLAALAAVGASVFKVLLDAGKTFGKFSDDTAKIRTLLTDEQFSNIDQPLLRLRQAAIETGEPIENLQKGLFNVISAVPALANNLDAAAVITQKASQTALGLGASTDSVVLAMTNLGNSLGIPLDDMENVNRISDVLANTFKQGVIPNAEALAGSIAKAGPEFSALFENSDDALNSLGAMTAVLTQNGVSVDESATNLRALGNELLDVNKRSQLMALGIEGINKETGKVEDIRKVIQSLAKDSELFTQVFTSKKAKAAVRIFTKDMGQPLTQLIGNFEQANEVSTKMFKTMASTGGTAAKQLDASFIEFQLTIGETASNVIDGSKRALAGALSIVTDLFKSTEQEFLESSTKLNSLNDNVDALGSSIMGVDGQIKNLNQEGAQLGTEVDANFKQLLGTAEQMSTTFPVVSEEMEKIVAQEETGSQDRLGDIQTIAETLGTEFPGLQTQIDAIINNKNLGTSEKFKQINDLTTQFQEKAPDAAAKIQSVVNVQEQKTVEALQKLNEQLGIAQELAKGEAFVESFKNAELALETLGGKINETGNNIVDLADEAGLISTGIGGSLGFDADVLDPIVLAQDTILITKDKINALDKERAGLDKTNIADAERSKEINDEIRNLKKIQRTAASESQSIENDIQKTFQQQLDSAKKLIEDKSTTASLEDEILRIRDDILASGGAQGITAELINQLATDALGIAQEGAILETAKSGEIEKANQLRLESLNTQLAELVAQQEFAEATGQVNEEESNLLQTQIDSLVTQMSQVDVRDELTSASKENVELQDEELKLIHKDVDALAGKLALVDDEAIGQDVINELLEQKLGTEEMSTEEKIKGIEAIIIEQNEQLKILLAQAVKLDNERKAIEMEIITIGLIGEEKRAHLEAAKAIAVKAAQSRQAAADLSKANAALGAQGIALGKTLRVRKSLGLGAAGGSRRRRSGGGSRRSKEDKTAEREAKKRAKAAEKAEKARQKARDKAFKDAQKREQKRAKAAEKARKERMKAAAKAEKRRLTQLQKQSKAEISIAQNKADEARKAKQFADERAAAEKKLIEDLKGFANNLRQQTSQFILGSISSIEKLIAPFRSEAEKLFRSLQNIGEQAGKQRERAETEIQTRETKLGVAKAGLGTAEKKKGELVTNEDIAKLSRANEELIRVNNSIDQLNTVSSDLGDKLPSALADITNKKKELRSLGFQISSIAGQTKRADPNVQAFGQAIDNLASAKKGKARVKAFNELEKAFTKIGGIVRPGKFEFQGLEVSVNRVSKAIKNSRKIFEKAGGSMEKAGRSADQNSDKVDGLRQQYRDLKGEINKLEAQTGSYFNTLESAGFRNLGQLKTRISNLNTAKIGLQTTIGKLKASTKGLGGELDVENKKIVAFELEIKKLDGEIAELNKTLSAGEKGLSQLEAQALIQQFQGAGLAFSEVSKQFEKVIKLQDEAFAATNPDVAVSKFNEAQRLLNQMTSDFELFGISLEQIKEQFGDLENTDPKRIEEILNAAFLPKDGAAELSDTQKAEKERARILLTNAIGLLKLQAKSKKNIIDVNESLEETVLLTKELIKEQQKYESSLGDAKTFIEQNKPTEQLSETEKLRNEYDRVNKALTIQLDLAKKVMINNKEIKKQSDIQLKNVEDSVEKERQNIEAIKDAREAAKVGGDQEAFNKLTEQLASAKQTLDFLTDSEKRFVKASEDASLAIKDQDDKLNKVTVSQTAASVAFGQASITAKEADLAQRISDLGTELGKLDSLNLFNFVDVLKDAGKAIDELFKLGETEKALNGISKMIENTVKTFSSLTDLTFEAIDNIQEIGNLVEKGDIGGAVALAGDLTTKVGEALLSAPPPLNIAGAIILGVGLLTKITAKIIALINGVEKDRSALAEQNLAIVNMQAEAYNEQLSIIETLSNLDSDLVDTAQERLDILRAQKVILDEQREVIDNNRRFSRLDLKQREDFFSSEAKRLRDEIEAIKQRTDLSEVEKDKMIAAKTKEAQFASDAVHDIRLIRSNGEVITKKKAIELGLIEDISILSNDELASKLSTLKADKVRNEFLKSELEGSKELGQEDRKRIATMAGFEAPDFIPEGTIDNMIDEIDVRLANADLDIVNFEGEIDFNIQETAEELAKFQDDITEFDFRIKAALDVDDTQKAFRLLDERTEAFRGKAETAFSDLGIDLSGVTLDSVDDVSRLINSLGDMEITPDLQADIQAFVDALMLADQTQADLSSGQIELIRAREAAGKLDTDEADRLILEILEAQKAALEAQFDMLNLTREQELEILAIDAEILGIKEKQNEQDTMANEALVKAVRERQKLVELLRQETQGGSIDPNQQARLQASEQKIVAELRSNGASEEEIQAFLRDLPAFSKGGVVGQTGLAMVEEGEIVIPRNQVQAIDDQIQLFSNMLAGNNAIFSGNDDLTRTASRIILQKEAQNVNNSMSFGINDIIINVNVPSTVSDPKRIADLVKSELSNTIMGTVQRGFDQNKIDIRGSKI